MIKVNLVKIIENYMFNLKGGSDAITQKIEESTLKKKSIDFIQIPSHGLNRLHYIKYVGDLFVVLDRKYNSVKKKWIKIIKIRSGHWNH